MSERRRHDCGGNHQPPTHFVGIGGAGMSAIARVLKAAGCYVQGSDRSENRVTEMLREEGIPVYIGHDARNLGADVERVVYTRAVPEDNPEIEAARRQKLPVIERAEMLGQLYSLFGRRASVAGSHGKTSTSAMLAVIMIRCGADPTVLIGGHSPDLDGNARLGLSPLIVAEACEAYGSFLHLRSSLALVTNVDEEHLDHYKTFEGVKDGFTAFLNLVDEDGVIVACLDDPHLMGLRPRCKRRWVTYGSRPEADYRVCEQRKTPEGRAYTLRGPGWQTPVSIPIPGKHFASNSAGAIAAAVELGCDPSEAAKALASFRGVSRRLELKGRANGVTVVDDYAHHPSEIRETVEALKEHYGGRLTVVFQPHLYSRTAEHLEGFARTLAPADRVVLTDVFAAREPLSSGVQTDALYDRMKDDGHPDLTYIHDLPDVAPRLAAEVRPGDVVVTVGAGDVYRAGEDLLRELGANPEEAA